MASGLRWLMTAALVLCCGCGGNKDIPNGKAGGGGFGGGGEQTLVTAKLQLSKLALTYHFFHDEKGRTPNGIDEFAKYATARHPGDKMIADGLVKIRSGNMIFLWNTKLFADGDRNDDYFLGYEKQVKIASGWVVMGGAYVQRMTKDEFEKYAPLPTK